MRPWILFPKDAEGWGIRANIWLDELRQTVEGHATALATLLNNVSTSRAQYNLTGSDIYAGWTLDTVGAYAPARISRDESGMVSCDAIVRNLSGGTLGSGSSVLAVPSGYRPSGRSVVVVVGSSVIGQTLYISPAGLVTTELAVPNGGYMSLNFQYRI